MAGDGDSPNGVQSTKALVRASIAASEANARTLETLSKKLDGIADDVGRLKLEDARRVSYLAGARTGAKLTLLAIAAAAGGSASKILDWLSK